MRLDYKGVKKQHFIFCTKLGLICGEMSNLEQKLALANKKLLGLVNILTSALQHEYFNP